MNIENLLKLVAAITALAFSAPTAAFTPRMTEEGIINCGVHKDHPGFSQQKDGIWHGLDVDFCRALSLAVFDTDDQVAFIPLKTRDRFPALQNGTVDVLSQTASWTLTRDTSMGLNFAGVLYFDSQGFLVRNSLAIDQLSQLLKNQNLTICVQKPTTSYANARDFFSAALIQPEWLFAEWPKETFEDFRDGKCNVITGDKAQLVAIGKKLKASNHGEFKILEEEISKEPLGPLVQEGNDDWFNVVRWTLNAMIKAEELGVNQKNVEEMFIALHLKALGVHKTGFKREIKRFKNVCMKEIQQAGSEALISRNNCDGLSWERYQSLSREIDQKREIAYLLGFEGLSARHLGVNKYWIFRIIKKVGNYGDAYNRHFGDSSPLPIPRNWNHIWKNGGHLYSPSFK